MRVHKILFFTKYTEKGPSSRYRSYQYRSYFEEYFDLEYLPLFDDNYILKLYGNKRKNYCQIIAAYLKRIIQVVKLIGTKDVIFIEYELLPHFPPILEYLLYISRVRVVLDYDDAIFHNYDLHKNFIVRNLLGKKISNIARMANYIITGSPYLTKYFKNYNRNVIEIPTSIIQEKYIIQPSKRKKKSFVVGWIGSKSTSSNILILLNVMKYINDINPNVVFKLMGFDSNLKCHFTHPNIQFIDWSKESEIEFLNQINLGIMPLYDNHFNRGKCGFKLIQYMAMGKPTLSTPLEANLKINRDNHNLFASEENEWIKSIIYASENNDYCNHIGSKNRKIVEKYYSVEVNAKLYIKLFKSLIDVRN